MWEKVKDFKEAFIFWSNGGKIKSVCKDKTEYEYDSIKTCSCLETANGNGVHSYEILGGTWYIYRV